MHSQALRGVLGTPVGGEEGVERADQPGVVPLVVGNQRAEGLTVQFVQLGQVLGGEDEPIDSEVAEEREVTGSLQSATEQERLASLGVGAPKADQTVANGANPKRNDAVAAGWHQTAQ